MGDPAGPQVAARLKREMVDGVRRVLITLVVLAVLLVGADRAAAWVAQRGLAAAIQHFQDLAETPQVHIGGFPFLIQAISGTYQQVDVSVVDLPTQSGLQVNQLQARLSGVHVPLQNVIAGDVQQVPVDAVTASANATFASLDAAVAQQIPSDRLTVHFGAGPGGALSITGDLATPLGHVTVQGQARLTVTGGKIQVEPVPGSLDGLPSAIRDQVASLLTVQVDLPGLPLGFRPTGVQVGGSGITVSAEGTNVVITPNGTTTAAVDLSGTDSTLVALPR